MKRTPPRVVPSFVTGLLVVWLPATAIAQAPPSLKLQYLEINQGVQNLTNGVKLIAGRKAVVRAYVSSTSQQPAAVTGRLEVSRPNEAPMFFDSAAPLTPGAMTEVTLAAMRLDKHRTLNFEVPDEAMRGTEVRMKLELFSSGERQACAGCDAMAPRTLHQVPPLRVKVVALRYRYQDRVYEPRDQDWIRMQMWLERAYPVPLVIFQAATVEAHARWPFGCQTAMAQLRALRAAEVGNAGSVDPRTHYYAVVYGDSAETFMQGCAPVAGTADPGTVGAGPTGPPMDPKFEWDTDGSIGDWYAGHELAHTFGRAHPGHCDSGAPLDPAYVKDPATGSARLASTLLAQTTDPTDVVGIDLRSDDWQVLPGRAWNDVMDYCANQWLNQHTYESLADRLIAEASASGPSGGEITEGPGVTPAAVAVLAAGPGLDQLPPSRGVVRPTEQPEAAQAPPPPVAEGQLLTVLARANREQGVGVIDAIIPVVRTYSKAYGTPGDETKGATMRVEYEGGVTRFYGCDLHEISGDPSQARGAVQVPTPARPITAPDYDTTIECTFPQGGVPVLATLLIDGKRVAEQASTKGRLQIRSASPIGGGAGGPVGSAPLAVVWSPSGHSSNVRYLLKMSVDAGKSWQVLAVGLKDPEFEIPADAIKGASEVHVEITAVDGMRTAVIGTQILTGPGAPPR